MAPRFPTNQSFEDFLQAPRGDKLIRLHISRNTLIAFVISVLIHALILFFVLPHIELKKPKKPSTFEVVLAQPEQAQNIPEQTQPELLPEPVQEPIGKPVTKPKVLNKQAKRDAKPSTFSIPDVLSTTKPAPDIFAKKENKPREEAPTDMMAFVNAQRAKREQAESEAAKQNADAAAREIAPSEDEKRDARIKSNFQNGTNGIFEITNLSSHSASFTFLGWLNDYSTSKRQFYEVEAPVGQDVRLVMIRRMIGLIREHYQGDFNWESHRLGRTVVKSARVEDSAELEDFLMIEFFGQNYKTVL